MNISGFKFCPTECPRRRSGCHATCEDYKSRRKEFERLKTIENKRIEGDKYSTDLSYRRKERWLKKQHLNGRNNWQWLIF